MCWCHRDETCEELGWIWGEMGLKWCIGVRFKGVTRRGEGGTLQSDQGQETQISPSIFSVWKLETVTWLEGENRGNLENSNSCNFLGIGDEQPTRVINWKEIENCGAIIRRRTGENGDQNIWKIRSRISLHHHFFRPNWQQVKRCWRGYEWVNHILNNLLFCRCFLEGGGSTDSFFVREDLQVDLMD